jgi:hypothetical protein
MGVALERDQHGRDVRWDPGGIRESSRDLVDGRAGADQATATQREDGQGRRNRTALRGGTPPGGSAACQRLQRGTHRTVKRRVTQHEISVGRAGRIAWPHGCDATRGLSDSRKNATAPRPVSAQRRCRRRRSPCSAPASAPSSFATSDVDPTAGFRDFASGTLAGLRRDHVVCHFLTCGDPRGHLTYRESRPIVWNRCGTRPVERAIEDRACRA